MRVVKRYHLAKGATYGIARDFMHKLWAFSASTLIVMGSIGGALPAIMGDNAFATSVGSTLFSKSTVDVDRVNAYTSSTIDASAHDNLKLDFDYNIHDLDNGDQFTYGWQVGSDKHVIGTINGINGDSSSIVTLPSKDLPSSAQVSGLQIYITVDANADSDKVTISNLRVSGDAVTPSSVTAGVGGDYATLQEAIDNVASGGTVNIISNLTATTQVTVNKLVTINGGGHMINPTFTMTDTSNNSVIGVQADNVTISNLIVDGAGGTSLHGINVYMATGINLDNVTLKNNDKSGLNINGSTVVVNNINTSGNSFIYGAINVDQADGVTTPARLTVNGTSSQVESLAIKIDDINKDTDVVINNSQYQSQVIGKYKIYYIQQAPEVLPPATPQAPQNLVFSRSNTNVNQGKMLDGSTTKVKPTNTGLDFVWTHWDKQPGVVYQIDTFYERNDGSWERIHHSDAVNGKTNPYRFYGFGSRGDGRYKTTVYVWDMVAKKRVSPSSAMLSYDSTPAKVKIVSLNQMKPIDGVDYTSAKLNSGFLDVIFTTDEPLKSGAVGFRIPGFAGPPATGWTYVTPTGNTNEYLAHMSLLDRTDKSVYANWKNFFVGKTYENINLYFHLTDKAGNTKSTYYALDSTGNPIDGWTTNVNDSRNYKFTLDNTEPIIQIISPLAGSMVSGVVPIEAKVTDNSVGIEYVTAKFTDGLTPEFGSTALTLKPGTTDTYVGQIDTTGHDGKFNLTVSTRDNVKNTRSSKAQNITIDNTAPDAPTNLRWLNGSGDTLGVYTNVNAVKPTWNETNCESGNCEVVQNDVEFYEYSYKSPVMSDWSSIQNVNDLIDSDQGTVSFKELQAFGAGGPGNGTEGQWQFRVRAVDYAGNRSSWAESNPIIYDHTPPQINASIADVNVDSQPIVSGTTDDPNSDVVVTPAGGSSQVINHEDFTDNGDGTYGWSVTLPVVNTPGSQTVNVESTDGAGNSAVDSVTATSPIKVLFNVINPSDNGGNNNGGNNNGGNNTGNPSNPSSPSGTNNPQANSGVAGAAAFAAPIAVSAPLVTGAGAPAVAVATPGVLGATTGQDKTPKLASNFADQGKVLGDTTAKSDDSKTCTKFLGICWYYWIPVVIIIVAVVWWWKYRHDAKAHNTSSRS